MSFNQDEYNLLISDKRTVMSFSNNDSSNGRIITMDAIIRPHSFLLNEKKTGIINPHRNMSDIPVEQIRACPRCGNGWHPVLHSSNKEDYTTYACETKCGVSICADTYMRFVSNQRVAKVDIPSTTGETMARAVETKPTLTFGGAIPEASPPPVVKTLVFGGIPSPSNTDNQKGGMKHE